MGRYEDVFQNNLLIYQFHAKTQKGKEEKYLIIILVASLREKKLDQTMAEDLSIIQGTKEEQYQTLLPQIKALIEGEPDLIANLANISAALKEQFSWLWVGFYLVKKDELVLGPFQGPVACTRISKGRGVCGAAWQQAQTLVVPDVERFPGHIACSSLSKSEIVIPLFSNNEITGVLDVDSVLLNDFDETDKKYLEEIVSWIAG